MNDNYNEGQRLQEREGIFNIERLQRLAAQAVSRDPEDVTDIEKLGEGAANRAFVICFKDGCKIVARIPYPMIEPKRLLVASEAATMIFLRTKGIPVPQVFGYSSFSENPAGTEYIFMEYCSGEQLSNVWDETGEGESTRFIRCLVDIEARLSEITLPASGSLYFLRDLPSNSPRIAVDPSDTDRPESIYLGPSLTPHFWFGRRSSLQVDRGPFTDTQSAMNAGAVKEMRYLEQYGRPLLPFNRFQRETFDFQKQPPAIHLDSLKKYLQVAKYLIPSNDSLCFAVLRHPDLRPSNVFVSDDFEITALIDWQHTVALPMFLSSGIPDFLDSWSHPVGAAESSTSPSDEDNYAHAELLRQKHRQDTYVDMVKRYDTLHYESLVHPLSIGRQKIHRLSSDPWQGDNVPLRSSLIFVEQNWSQISSQPDIPCPISFTDEEEREILRLDDAEQQGVEQLEDFKRTLGLGPEGWVTNENYDAAKEAIARMKEMSLQQAESEGEVVAIRDHWVFDDMDEDEYL